MLHGRRVIETGAHPEKRSHAWVLSPVDDSCSEIVTETELVSSVIGVPDAVLVMSDEIADDQLSEERTAGGIIRRQISPESETAEHDFLEIIMALEDKSIEELPSLYHELDHVIEILFRTPPSHDAQLSVSFTYAGYRITMDQSGTVKLLKVTE